MKHGITIRYGANISTVAVSSPLASMTFDRSKMTRKQEHELRKEIVRAFKESREC